MAGSAKNKKNLPQKKTTGKNNKKNKVKNSVKAEKSNTWYEVSGVIWIALALFCCLCLFVDSLGFIGTFVKKVLFVLTGRGRFLLPVIFAVLGYYFITEKKDLKMSNKLWGFALCFLSVLGLLHSGIPVEESLEVAKQGEPIGGGLFGALISYLVVKLFGMIGSYVFFSALILISLILITNYTIKQMAEKVGGNSKSFLARCRMIGQEAKKIIPQRKTNAEKEEDKEASAAEAEKIRMLSRLAASDGFEDEKDSYKRSGSERGHYWQILNSENEADNKMSSEIVEEPVIYADDTSAETEAANVTEIPETADNGEQQIIEFNNQDDNNDGYLMPPLELLHKSVQAKSALFNKSTMENAQKLEETLLSFGIEAKVTNVECGPSITRYELQPPVGVKVSRILNLADDLALKLAAPRVRIEAPIPGKAAIGIEVPNNEVTTVHLRELLESNAFINARSNLSVALGKDIGGNPKIIDLAQMPHLLIAGATGSGKSVCVNVLIASILFKARPDEVKFLLIDPKRVELTNYNGIPHLIQPVVINPKKAAVALRWAVKEMEDRYSTFEANAVRDIYRYNQLVADKRIEKSKPMPQIVILIDELSDLMMAAPKDVEDSICRLAQMARAAGMHLVIATQRPSVDVITGLIKANIPSRISFAVSSQVDSRTILDMAGAEKLLGKGDMLYSPIGADKPIRIQGPYLSDREIENLVAFLRDQKEAQRAAGDIQTDTDEPEILPEDFETLPEESEAEDEKFWEAVQLAVDAKKISTSFLQRKLKVGYNRASRIIELMEERGYVSQYEGGKRDVLLTKEQLAEIKGNV